MDDRSIAVAAQALAGNAAALNQHVLGGVARRMADPDRWAPAGALADHHRRHFERQLDRALRAVADALDLADLYPEPEDRW